MLSEEDDRKYDQARRISYPVYLRHERRKGWTADLPIYVLWCEDCRKWSENYPAGHAGRIHCNGCRAYVALNVVAKWKRDLFYAAMTVAPRSTLRLVQLYQRLFGSAALPAPVSQADAPRAPAAEPGPPKISKDHTVN